MGWPDVFMFSEIIGCASALSCGCLGKSERQLLLSGAVLVSEYQRVYKSIRRIARRLMMDFLSAGNGQRWIENRAHAVPFQSLLELSRTVGRYCLYCTLTAHRIFPRWWSENRTTSEESGFVFEEGTVMKIPPQHSIKVLLSPSCWTYRSRLYAKPHQHIIVDIFVMQTSVHSKLWQHFMYVVFSQLVNCDRKIVRI